ncbi:hypothetical protein WU24_14205 [Bordetella pertussis]|nr:hypothetical protein RD11_11890 [Bordetella pertussis]AMS69959.1 hypothetical protein RD15_12610 [Bordetella pertussis]AMS84337.1 hypothetical protein RD06_11415 [Bordetella pertussis]AMT06089.1 hypothetical protein OZ70_11425 [Bordetella pertussis]AMT13289.1 hypothetical protein RD21_11435 [Bordetella pertussis]
MARRRSWLARTCSSSVAACARAASRCSSSPPSIYVLASASTARAWNSQLVVSPRSLARSILPRPRASMAAWLSRSTATPAPAAAANNSTKNASVADSAAASLSFFRIGIRK